jgi:hypothetical protein
MDYRSGGASWTMLLTARGRRKELASQQPCGERADARAGENTSSLRFPGPPASILADLPVHSEDPP